MQLARPAIAANPLRFGRARLRDLASPTLASPPLSDELKLFGTTFLLGFVFVSVLIA